MNPATTLIVKNKETKKTLNVMKGQENHNQGNHLPKGARIGFGIFMVLIYIGVGLLFIFNVFDIWNRTIGYIVGGLLCLYGIWRGYRLYIESN